MFTFLLILLLLLSLLLRLLNFLLGRQNQFPADSVGVEVPLSSSTPELEHEEVSQISSPSGSAPSSLKYVVFLSFKGETRLSFTDNLYYALNRKGIHTFRDAENLRKGGSIRPQLLEAIEQSRFAVVVFSKNYAASTWCLDELAHIAKCKKMGLKVYPVFHDITKPEVKYQTGNFGKAFAKHEKRLEDMGRVDNWRKALKEIADDSGWDLQNRPQSIVIQEIAKEISDILNHYIFLMANKDLIGMDARIERMEPCLALDSDDVRILGILGLGGIGKTTIAHEVFKRIRDQFDASAFVGNVREESQKVNGLVHLQRHLYELLLDSNSKIMRVDTGISFLRERLQTQKVLIILDDVDELPQIEALAGGRPDKEKKITWLGRGSRVIITTRDDRLLKAWGVLVDNIYRVEEMTVDEASQLLCQKAFNENDAPDDYKELTKKMVKYAGGIPLALEVMGSNLRERNVTECSAALDRVLDGDPEKRVFDVLRISFDGLKYTERKMFLDIACFFKGEDQDRVKKIFESCGFHPKIGIPDLIDKSLITVERNKLWMHDLLQQLGWDIVKQESPEHHGKRSRLWVDENTYQHSRSWLNRVFTHNTGTIDVEGIFLTLPAGKEELLLKADPFEEMQNLRLLKICNVKFSGRIEDISLSNTLRVLEWHDCPLESLPSSFQPDHLVELKMPNSRIKQLWNKGHSLKMLVQLDLSKCHYLTQLPDFTNVPNLEGLILESCEKLSKLHPTIWNLQHLALLNLKGCENLETLPLSICLESLKTLILSGCSKLNEFPEIVGNMESLSELYLDGTAIKELPVSMQHLKGLILLNLNGCKNLLSIPGFICSLTSLKYLYLSGCSCIDLLPEHLGSLEHLQELDACKTAIRKVPSSILRLKNPKRLCFRGSTHLPTNFSESMGLQLPKYSISRLCSLVSFDVPESFGCCWSSVQRLDLNEDEFFISIPETAGFYLEDLELDSCEIAIRKVPSFNLPLKSLENLYSRILLIDDYRPLGHVNSYLYCSGWAMDLPTRMPDLRNLFRNLTSLKLFKSHLGEEAFQDDICCLCSLKYLYLNFNKFVSIPESISELSKLRELSLFGCSRLQSLPKYLPLSLKFVDARQCTMLKTCPKNFMMWTADEASSFVDDNDEHVDLVCVKYIEDRIYHEEPFEMCFPHPYTRKPKWCSHGSSGCTVTIQISDAEDSNSTWMGIALFVVFEILENGNFDGSWELKETFCHFHTDKGRLQNPLVFQNFNDFTVGSYELCCYEPISGRFADLLNEASELGASVSTERPDLEVKWCGIQAISQQDAALFVCDLANTAKRHLDFRFIRHCKGILRKVINFESFIDMMVLGYNLQEPQYSSTVNESRSDYNIEPRSEDQQRLLTLLSRLYEERNARENTFTFWFPYPVILPWFSHLYSRNVAGCSLPERLFEDKRWVGLELCVAFSLRPSGHSLSFSSLQVDFYGLESGEINVLVLHSLISADSSSQFVVSHIPRAHFPKQWNQCQGIAASIRATDPDVEIIVCGCRLVYEQDFKDLIHSLTACTFEQPHALDLLLRQAKFYVEEMVIACWFKRSITQAQVQEHASSLLHLQKYLSNLQLKQSCKESDHIIVHSKRLVLENRGCIGHNVAEAFPALACDHLHIMVETELSRSHSSEQWKKYLKLLLRYSKVVVLSLNGHMVYVLKHFNPSSTYNFCFPEKKMSILKWFWNQSSTPTVRIQLPPKLYEDQSWRGIVISAAFSVDKLPTTPLVNLLCHLRMNDCCLNPAPICSITKEKFKRLYCRGFIWLTYIPSALLKELNNSVSDVEARIHTSFSGLTVKKCGVRLLYRQQEEELKQVISHSFISFFDNLDVIRQFLEDEYVQPLNVTQGTLHELPMLGRHMKDFDRDFIYNATLVSPEIPNWFGDRGSWFLDLQLPPSLCSDKDWIGLAICASCVDRKLDPKYSYYFHCYLETRNNNLTSAHSYRIPNEKYECLDGRSFIWLSYIPRRWFLHQLNDVDALEISFRDSKLWPESCGARLVYRHNEEEFRQLYNI